MPGVTHSYGQGVATAEKRLHMAQRPESFAPAIDDFLKSWKEDSEAGSVQPDEGQGENQPPEAPTDAGTTPEGSTEPEGGQQVDGPPAGDQPETPPAEAEVPEFLREAIDRKDYFGLDLSDFTDEQLQALVPQLHEKWTKETNRLQQENARLREAQPPAQPTEEPQQPAPEQSDEQQPEGEPSDADLLRLYGYDPEDPMIEATLPALMPMVRRQFETDQYLLAREEAEYLDTLKTEWQSTIAQMEETYGKLPVDRSQGDEAVLKQVFEFAVENGIEDPEVAYIKMVEPYRRGAAEAVRTARQSRTTPEPPAPKPNTVRPKPSEGEEAPKPLDLRASILAAEKDTGKDWGDLHRDLLEEVGG